MFARHSRWFEPFSVGHEPARLCFADGDGDTGGAGGSNGVTPPPVAPPPAQPNWDNFFGDLRDTLGGKIDNLTSTVQAASNRPPPAPPEEPPDLDAMTRAEYGNYIMSQMMSSVKELVTEALRPVGEQLSSVHNQVTVDTVERQIGSMRSAHKDFNDWNAELQALATENPAIMNGKGALRDMYLLVRARNPEKATELDRKYNPPKESPRLPFSFGAPGNGGGGSTNKPLSRDEASRAAFDEVAERHPILLALQGMK